MNFQNGYGGGGGPGFQPGMMFPNPYGMQGNMGGGYGGYGGGRGRGGRRDDRGGGRGRGGGGHRGGDHRPPAPESSNARLRRMVIKFGDEEDFDVLRQSEALAASLKRQWAEGMHGVFDGFRIGVTQEPHKHHFFVTLLLQLSQRSADEPARKEEDEPVAGEKRKAEEADAECGREVLEDLSRGFRGWVEGREWLNVRLCLQFFSLLVPAGLITAQSLVEVYKTLLGVLDEVGGGGDRSERVVRAVAEGLMRSGKALYEMHSDEVDGLIRRIETYVQERKSRAGTESPFHPITLAKAEQGGEDGEEVERNVGEPEPYLDSIAHLLTALQSLRETGFEPPACLPKPWEALAAEQSAPFELASVTVPPEIYDADEGSSQGCEGQSGTLAFFAEDVVLPPTTPQGWTLLSLVLDLVTLYEVNRKECARLLLALRQFVSPNTFKPLASSSDADPSVPPSTLSLESLAISVLLGAMLTFPRSPSPLIYYGSVITELCKLSPNTVAPPVGRAVRRMYGMMGGEEGLDGEVASRLAQWFAVHLSNFGFMWMWKEWVPDLELPPAHPKRAFMRRVVELEVRLAYHERIMDTLPPAMTEPGAGVLAKEAPEPVWAYEKPDHPLHAEAADLLKLFRQKQPASQILVHLESLPDASAGPGEPIKASIRKMAFETLLHLGARSFSHFLNATERYLDLLRQLSPDAPSRRVLLEAVADFWQWSAQLRTITVDKYLQYGVVEPSDVVDWVFAEEGKGGMGGEEADGWTDGWEWEMLSMCVGKAVGKVESTKRKLKEVEREDERARARRVGEKLERGEGQVGDVEQEDEEIKLERSQAAKDAQSALESNEDKLREVLWRTTQRFAETLLPWRENGDGQGLRMVTQLLENGEQGGWAMRARLMAWREFCRRYRAHLRTINERVEAYSQTGVPVSGSPGRQAEALVWDAWRETVGSGSV